MSNGVALDLNKFHSRREVGDYVVYVSWYGEKLEDAEPCLAIIPRFRTHYRPAVICLSAAFKYGSPEYMRECIHNVGIFARDLGDGSLAAAHKLATIIRDSIGDLVSAPPKPVEATRYVGDATITTENGQKVVELYEDV